MAYIGQNADGNFTTTPAKDTFNGDGSTVAFTLSQGGATNTVDVFVENVRQEPTEAYSVDGTTLTFTEAPGTGTGNIYVVNRGPAQLTATHPAGQALEAYSGTFSTSVTAQSMTVTDDLTVDTNTLYVDSTNNRVGVGTGSPTGSLDIARSGDHEVVFRTTSTGDPTINLQADGQNNGKISYSRSGEALTFSNSGSERMRIQSGGGISFNGDTAAANALDDYEEGTWTPYLVTTGGLTYSDQTGNYTKIGDTVFVQGTITFTGSITGGTNIRFFLPFSPIGSSTYHTAGVVGNATAIVSGSRANIFVSSYAGTNSFYVYNHSGGVYNYAAAWQAGTFNFSIQYKV